MERLEDGRPDRASRRVVTKIFASEVETTVASVLGAWRQSLRRPLRVALASDPVGRLQPRILSFRSRVWPEVRGRPTLLRARRRGGSPGPARPADGRWARLRSWRCRRARAPPRRASRWSSRCTARRTRSPGLSRPSPASAPRRRRPGPLGRGGLHRRRLPRRHGRAAAAGAGGGPAADPRPGVVQNDRNLGLSRSLNRALAMVETDYVLTCHGDCRFGSDDYLARAVALLDENPDVAVVSGQSIADVEAGLSGRRRSTWRPT